jgi:hypothetical protein
LNFKAENKGDLYHLCGLVGPEDWKICGKRACQGAGRQI